MQSPNGFLDAVRGSHTVFSPSVTDEEAITFTPPRGSGGGGGPYSVIHDGKESFGAYFEDFREGELFKHWLGNTVTEADNHHFSLLTMNLNLLHIDEGYMKGHQHGRVLANGLLALSLVVGMSVRDNSGRAIASLEYERITHDGPLFQGDTVYAETEVLEVRASRSRQDRGTVCIGSRAFNQCGERVLMLRRRFLVPKIEA